MITDVIDMTEITDRNVIARNKRITLFRKDHTDQDVTFTIRSLVGEGGSSVCYSAESGGRRGRLKEFYPMDTSLGGQDHYFFLQRTAQNQLVPVGDGMAQRFGAMCRDFLYAYEILEQAKKDNRNREVLNNYIPAYELFIGKDADGSPASVYVWTPNDKKGKNFEDYLTEVRKHPQRLPEHKLYNIINTLITFTDCIRILHAAQLLYLDVKPSNFLVPFDGEMNINTHNVSLYDINSIYALSSDFPKVSGTPGFRAPEVLQGKAENRSDIYSIGAILFYGIVISDDLPSPLYSDACYDDLEQLLENSKLIRASETNSSLSVKYILTKILKKCLAKRPRQRYGSCEELIADLKMARTYLIPDIFGASLGMNKRLAILDKVDGTQCNPTAIMQNLLYTTPLYTVPTAPGEAVNVLVVGAGTYGQKFIDVCLQTGQMMDHPLRVTAVSRDAELNREVYLHYRPALANFVDVDGSLARSDLEAYAQLQFTDLNTAFVKANPARNREIAQTLLSGRRFHYVFISLGDDDLNYDVAKAIHDQKPGCPIHFVVQTPTGRTYKKGSPVCVNEKISPATISPELERMAFNAHLSWCDPKTLDMRAARKQFREKYNYTSSISYALSIFYKLRSVGITTSDLDQAAAEFHRTVLQAPDDTAYRSLVALEHRRWVLEKVTDGWTSPLRGDGTIDYEGCIRRGQIADRILKLHPCITRSSTAAPLSRPDFDWENPGEALDPLDRMSVGLHNALKETADDFRRSQPMHSDDILALRKLAAGQPEEVQQAYRRYLHCLQHILDGNRNYSGMYRQYEDDLAAAMKKALPASGKEITRRLGWIRKKFFPVIESNLCRNYKANDEVLVRNISYILTNTHQPYIAMAFEDAQAHNGRNDVTFNNVAAASVLFPGKITYLYDWDTATDADRFLAKARTALQYFEKRHIHTRVSFVVAVRPGTAAAAGAGLESLRETTALADYTLLPCENEEAAMDAMVNVLASRRVDLFDGSTQLFRSQAHNYRFISRVLELLPYFEFDRATQTFPVCQGCQRLKYIQGGAYLRIEDMFALMNAADNKFNHPEFAEDYKALWAIYTGAELKGPFAFRNGVTNWNQLCAQLSDYFTRVDKIADLALDADTKGFEKHFVFFFPSYGYQAARLLLEKLLEQKVVTEKSALRSHASDTCRIDLYTHWNIGPVLESIFSRPHLLADPKYLTVTNYYRGNTMHVILSYNNLAVENLLLEDKFSLSVLEQLSRKHFISTIRKSTDNPQRVSFVFTSPRMKKMLTTAGEILEVYSYYEAMKTGYFDDLACGYEFKGVDDVLNEVDCILTKGFQSVIVECKARKQLDQNFYHKLLSISEQFGVGAKRVLITNTYEHTAYLDEMNSVQIQRGKQMGIITIHKPEEIQNIGDTLSRIMAGTYQPD